MPFFFFRQNNSGGVFETSDSIKHFVVIEADTPQEANDFAESVGVYFDGCERNLDCPCCGDRWQRADASDAFTDNEAKEFLKMLVFQFNHGADEFILYQKQKLLSLGG